MNDTVRLSIFIHVAILAAFMLGCATHRPALPPLQVMDFRATEKTEDQKFFDKAMKDLPSWEQKNEHRYSGYEEQSFTDAIARLKRDLMDCDKVRNDPETFSNCTDEISKDYDVLRYLEAELKHNPRKV